MNPIFIIQRIFPKYRQPIFDAIHRNVDFTLLHSTNNSGIKQTEASYSVKIKKWQYSKNDTHLLLFVFGQILKKKPAIIIHELAAGILTLPMVLLLRKILGYKFLLWGHMYDHKVGFYPAQKKMDAYRLWLQRKADGIITYSKGEKDILVKHGIKQEKIFVAYNTLDTQKFLKIRDSLEGIGKNAIKAEVGFTHQYNLIFIGRLYEEKLPEILIGILQQLKQMQSNLSVAIHYVGTGSMEDKLRLQVEKLNLSKDVFFHGEIYDEQTNGKLLFASDIMVMPGCVGLSVNHAFCFNCPVITFEAENNLPAHGPEIEYVIDSKTGFLVKNNDVAAMSNKIFTYLQHVELQNEVKAGVKHLIENQCSIDNLVKGFKDAISYVSSKK